MKLRLLSCLLLTVCVHAESSKWKDFVTGYFETYYMYSPTSAVQVGRHEFDGKLPDMRPETLASQIAWLKAQRAKAEAFKTPDLSPSQEFERDFLLSGLRRDLFWLETVGEPFRNPGSYMDTLSPDVYLTRHYAPLQKRLAAFITYAEAVPAFLAQARSNLKPPLARPLIAIARLGADGMVEFFGSDVRTIFQEALTPAIGDRFDRATKEAIAALKSYSAWLAEQEKTAHDDFALGEKTFLGMLREVEDLEITLPELKAVLEKDLARNTRALEQACAAFAPGKTLEEAIAIAKQDKPKGSVVEEATEQLESLRRFVIEKDVVTIPGDEKALVAEAPPYQRWNFAYIQIPSGLDRSLPSIYFVSPPLPTWPIEKQKAYIPSKASLLFTSSHEVWPGHFLQFLYSNRNPSVVAWNMSSYAYVEGWAHYAEEMMWDLGLGEGDPKVHIGQLGAALLRNVRFLSAVGLHTGGMTVEQSKEAFIKYAHASEGSAEQQANRGTFDPGYLSYTLGKLMIMKLRDDWCATRGGKAAWKQFHDEFLTYGPAPIPLVRKAMLGPNDSGTVL